MNAHKKDEFLSHGIQVAPRNQSRKMKSILLAKFKEEDVIAGKNMSGLISLKQVVNKLEKLKIEKEN
ncbi:MAG: hypothetical protein GXO85_12960 [Chlorobi bacterium]|nr:hypothetical protein [Chlorobiota bacterium]